MLALFRGAVIVCCLVTAAFAIEFPQLTGRVVDQANVMSSESRADLESKLKDLEDKSGIQLVVATVKSLQGSDIETYANELFRTWKLGQAQKNNGVLLLVAPAEHKVRIEVGYGLEGTLTDALSSVIISSAMVPRFKANDYSGGIERGVDGIVSVLGGDTADWQPKVNVRSDQDDQGIATFPIIILLFIIYIIWTGYRNSTSGHYGTRGGGPWFIPTGGSSRGSSDWGGGGGGFSDGGGFSGGGGSSGGGGASGSW
jgi:uncharacterized protein